MERIHLPDPVAQMGKIFSKHGAHLYLVGGYVRNLLLGLPGSDFDVCSSATPEEVDAICKREKLFHFPKGKFGTIEIHLRNGRNVHVFEHTTFRSDVYKEGGHHRPVSVSFTTDIFKDASRRDFTLNALYASTLTGDVLDPTGHGVDDLHARTLRACMKDPWDTMGDDAHRLLRMARLACEHNFTIEPETYKAAKYCTRYLVNISFERIRDELNKVLLSDLKYGDKQSPKRGVDSLMELGALEYILPSVARAKGVALPKEAYDCDLYDHLVGTMSRVPPIKDLRIAALLHDIGRKACPHDVRGKKHELIGAQDAEIELRRLHYGANHIKAICGIIQKHMYDFDNTARPIDIRRKAVEMGLEPFSRLLDLRAADYAASGVTKGKADIAAKWRKELDLMKKAEVPMTLKELKINGDIIFKELNVKKPNLVGKILSELMRRCVKDPSLNKEELLIIQAKEIFARLSTQNGAGTGRSRRRRRRRRKAPPKTPNNEG